MTQSNTLCNKKHSLSLSLCGWFPKVWEFSSLFSKVDRWCFDDVPSMSEHLKVCPFYQREELSQPVKLASMEGARERPQGLLDLSQEYDLPLAAKDLDL